MKRNAEQIHDSIKKRFQRLCTDSLEGSDVGLILGKFRGDSNICIEDPKLKAIFENVLAYHSKSNAILLENALDKLITALATELAEGEF